MHVMAIEYFKPPRLVVSYGRDAAAGDSLPPSTPSRFVFRGRAGVREVHWAPGICQCEERVTTQRRGWLGLRAISVL